MGKDGGGHGAGGDYSGGYHGGGGSYRGYSGGGGDYRGYTGGGGDGAASDTGAGTGTDTGPTGDTTGATGLGGDTGTTGPTGTSDATGGAGGDGGVGGAGTESQGDTTGGAGGDLTGGAGGGGLAGGAGTAPGDITGLGYGAVAGGTPGGTGSLGGLLDTSAAAGALGGDVNTAFGGTASGAQLGALAAQAGGGSPGGTTVDPLGVSGGSAGDALAVLTGDILQQQTQGVQQAGSGLVDTGPGPESGPGTAGWNAAIGLSAVGGVPIGVGQEQSPELGNVMAQNAADFAASQQAETMFYPESASRDPQTDAAMGYISDRLFVENQEAQGKTMGDVADEAFQAQQRAVQELSAPNNINYPNTGYFNFGADPGIVNPQGLPEANDPVPAGNPFARTESENIAYTPRTATNTRYGAVDTSGMETFADPNILAAQADQPYDPGAEPAPQNPTVNYTIERTTPVGPGYSGTLPGTDTGLFDPNATPGAGWIPGNVISQPAAGMIPGVFSGSATNQPDIAEQDAGNPWSDQSFIERMVFGLGPYSSTGPVISGVSEPPMSAFSLLPGSEANLPSPQENEAPYAPTLADTQPALKFDVTPGGYTPDNLGPTAVTPQIVHPGDIGTYGPYQTPGGGTLPPGTPAPGVKGPIPGLTGGGIPITGGGEPATPGTPLGVGGLDQTTPRGGFEGGPRPYVPPFNPVIGAAGGLTAQQLSQVQQIQNVQQGLVNQWVQQLLNVGYSPQDIQQMMPQIQAQVNQSMQSQGINVAQFLALQQQMAA